jgi:frataxin
VNKHGPTKQIWLSSPKSGARHYGFDAVRGQWRDTRGDSDLLSILAGELGATLIWRPE